MTPRQARASAAAIFVILASASFPGLLHARGETGGIGEFIAKKIGSMIGKETARSFFDSPSFAEKLAEMANELNRRSNLPIQIGEDIRLDYFSTGPGRRIVYNYTVVRYYTADIDISGFRNTMGPRIIQRACTFEDMQAVFKYGFTAGYVYRDPAGTPIATIDVRPQDCATLSAPSLVAEPPATSSSRALPYPAVEQPPRQPSRPSAADASQTISVHSPPAGVSEARIRQCENTYWRTMNLANQHSIAEYARTQQRAEAARSSCLGE